MKAKCRRCHRRISLEIFKLCKIFKLCLYFVKLQLLPITVSKDQKCSIYVPGINVLSFKILSNFGLDPCFNDSDNVVCAVMGYSCVVSLFMGALIYPVIYLVFIAAAILGFAAGCEYHHLLYIRTNYSVVPCSEVFDLPQKFVP